MKTTQEWVEEYAESHQNKTNVLLHTICVPAIYFSIICLLKSIPFAYEFSFYFFNFNIPIHINVLSVTLFFIMLFYFRLSSRIFLRMLLFTVLCLVTCHYLAIVIPIFEFAVATFIIAWVGQFYGHKLEGKKPSFFKDLQFLLIGPVWVFEKLFK